MVKLKTNNLNEWLTLTNKVRKEYWDTHFSYREYVPFVVTKGRKFIKLIDSGSVWGFVCMFDGEFKGQPVKKGDLMKPAGRMAPAKHSRGNIFDGTALFSYNGPNYLI